jgi:hypothetical protein
MADMVYMNTVTGVLHAQLASEKDKECDCRMLQMAHNSIRNKKLKSIFCYPPQDLD